MENTALGIGLTDVALVPGPGLVWVPSSHRVMIGTSAHTVRPHASGASLRRMRRGGRSSPDGSGQTASGRKRSRGTRRYVGNQSDDRALLSMRVDASRSRPLSGPCCAITCP